LKGGLNFRLEVGPWENVNIALFDKRARLRAGRGVSFLKRAKEATAFHSELKRTAWQALVKEAFRVSGPTTSSFILASLVMRRTPVQNDRRSESSLPRQGRPLLGIGLASLRGASCNCQLLLNRRWLKSAPHAIRPFTLQPAGKTGGQRGAIESFVNPSNVRRGPMNREKRKALTDGRLANGALSVCGKVAEEGWTPIGTSKTRFEQSHTEDMLSWSEQRRAYNKAVAARLSVGESARVCVVECQMAFAQRCKSGSRCAGWIGARAERKGTRAK